SVYLAEFCVILASLRVDFDRLPDMRPGVLVATLGQRDACESMQGIWIVGIFVKRAFEPPPGARKIAGGVRANAFPTPPRGALVVQRSRTCPLCAQHVLEARDARGIAIGAMPRAGRSEIGAIVE